MKKKWIVLLALGSFLLGSLLAIKLTNIQIEFTGVISSNLLFKVGGRGCELSEGQIYLANTVHAYEQLYGKELFEQDFGGVDGETFFKENVVSRLSKVKAMNNLAEKWEVSLSKEEKAAAKEAAAAYLSELGEKKAQKLGVTEKLLVKMYEEYARAKKAYKFFTEGSHAEVSEDEARVIVVWHIYFKTYDLDEKGEIVSFSKAEKSRVYGEAQEVLNQLQAGADFSEMAEKYSDDSVMEYTIGRGEMPKEFDETAFELEAGEMGGLVQTPYGFHIIKCILDFEERETALNKKQLLEKKQNEELEKIYEEYTKKHKVEVNTDKWEKVTLESMEELETGSFFDIYKKYFESGEENKKGEQAS